MTEEIEDLVEALESIRSQDFPEIPPELVEDIVRIEKQTIEEREKTQDRISETVESRLEELR
jgi:hypothetical protein